MQGALLGVSKAKTPGPRAGNVLRDMGSLGIWLGWLRQGVPVSRGRTQRLNVEGLTSGQRQSPRDSKWGRLTRDS